MKVHTSKPLILTLSGTILLVLAAGGVLLTQHTHPRTAHPAHAAKTQLSPGQTRQVAATSNTQSTVQGRAAQANVTVTGSACKLLTLAVAQKVLGTDAKTTPPGDTVTLQASNTSLSACAYSSSTTGSVQVVIRTPTDSLGVSKNAIVFGSGKPHSAVTVQGYGQAAYWDPDKHCLNVLGNNNWYIITRSTGLQTDAEAVAKLLVSEF